MLTRILEIGREYWADVCLWTGLAVVAALLLGVHLVDLRRRRRSSGKRPDEGGGGYERPPFPVDYGPSRGPDDPPGRGSDGAAGGSGGTDPEDSRSASGEGAPRRNGCDRVMDCINGIQGEFRSILLAAAKRKHLPASIPASAAIHIAITGKRCLLIDLDTKNSDIEGYFGIPEEASEAGDSGSRRILPLPSATGYDNLQVWPGHKVRQHNIVDIAEMVSDARSSFDTVLVYAPCFGDNPADKALARLCGHGLVFCGNTGQAMRPAAIMRDAGCEVVGTIKGL
ncbi:MAG: hypothetical protein IH624_08860 [Phycisphaerae bacterium]|nr:hypothetical protein [Phycisphaerae bacterium]